MEWKSKLVFFVGLEMGLEGRLEVVGVKERTSMDYPMPQ